MKFLTLVWKELCEALPIVLIAAVLFLTVGGLLVRVTILYNQMGLSYRAPEAGSLIDPRSLRAHSLFQFFGGWLLLVSVGLGWALAARHFWVPYYTRTWPFLLHRSAGRQTILAAKLTAATTAFAVSLGAIWSSFHWYVSQPEVSVFPPPLRPFIEGWIFILLGLIVYLGTALTGVSSARWYTTRAFGLAFATIVIFATIMQWRLSFAFAAIIIGAGILLSQLFHTFAQREF